MNQELKPCPFCGNKAKLTESSNAAPFICCSWCEVEIYGLVGGQVETVDEVIHRWNSRPSDVKMSETKAKELVDLYTKHIPDWEGEPDIEVVATYDAIRLLTEYGLGDEWISVKERLPGITTRVLAYHPDWGVREGSLGEDGVVGNWANNLILATHWKPLPAPPAIEKGDEG